MSRDYQLITTRRPTADAFRRALRLASGGVPTDITGDFTNVDDYLNIRAHNLVIDLEPPGHVEATDLTDLVDAEVTLPEPDAEGCLWYAVAHVPIAGLPHSGDVIRLTFERLASTFDGIAIEG